MTSPQNIVRLRILAAAVALEEFTPAELAAYAGANVNTVRSQLKRDGDYFAHVSDDDPPRRPARMPGRPPNRWRVSDREGVIELLRAFDGTLAPLRPPATSPAPSELRGGAQAALSVAENAVLDAWEAADPEIRELLVDTARNSLATARSRIVGDDPAFEAISQRADALDALLEVLGVASSDAEHARGVGEAVGELASAAGWKRGKAYCARLVELALAARPQPPPATRTPGASRRSEEGSIAAPTPTPARGTRVVQSGGTRARSTSEEPGLLEKARLTAGQGLHSVKTLAEAGLIKPERPDKTVRALLQIQRWGYTPAAGYAANASRYGDEDAIIDELGTLTFAEVHDRTNRLANAWADAGIVEGDSIGVMCRNHRYFVEAVVAASKLGVDCLLLNPALSELQLAEVVQREAPVALVHDEEFIELMGAVGGRRKRFVGWTRRPHHTGVGPALRELIERGDPEQPVPPAETGRVVILTSGTGSPKGASRKQPETIGPTVALLSRIPLKARDKTFIAAPLFHSWGFAHFTLGLMLGSTFVLRRKFDPEDTLSTIARQRVRSAPMLPVMVQRIMRLPDETRKKYDLSSLRSIPLSGEGLSGALAVRFMDEFGDILYSVYGTPEVAWASIATPEDLRAAPGTAGAPPRGTVLKIYDEDGKERPPYEIGRIFVGNEMLFEGYTSGGNKDVIDGLMSTGDVGYLDEEGRLHVAGRRDEVVVSGGYNLYPREVENLISNIKGVDDVAVIGIDDEYLGQRLKAFVVTKGSGGPSEDEIKSKVKSDLARYKVPREVEFLDELPRDATGRLQISTLTSARRATASAHDDLQLYR